MIYIPNGSKYCVATESNVVTLGYTQQAGKTISRQKIQHIKVTTYITLSNGLIQNLTSYRNIINIYFESSAANKKEITAIMTKKDHDTDQPHICQV